MAKIKLMTDYGCFPIWGVDKVGNIDPETLPISNELRASLARWAAWYDGTLNDQDPALSGFLSKEEEQAFEVEGKKLWSQLRNELRGLFSVVYFSTLENRVYEY